MSFTNNLDAIKYISLYVPFNDLINYMLINKNTFETINVHDYWSYRGLMIYGEKINSRYEYEKYYDACSKQLYFLCHDYETQNLSKIIKLIKIDIDYIYQHEIKSSEMKPLHHIYPIIGYDIFLTMINDRYQFNEQIFCEKYIRNPFIYLCVINSCQCQKQNICDICKIINYVMETGILEYKSKYAYTKEFIEIIIDRYINALILFSKNIQSLPEFFSQYNYNEIGTFISKMIFVDDNFEKLSFLIDKKIIFNTFYTAFYMYYNNINENLEAYYNPIFYAIESSNERQLDLYIKNNINLVPLCDANYDFDKLKKSMKNETIINILKKSQYYDDFILYLSNK